jgi:adenylate kinase
LLSQLIPHGADDRPQLDPDQIHIHKRNDNVTRQHDAGAQQTVEEVYQRDRFSATGCVLMGRV